jgi:hypothetical protein
MRARLRAMSEWDDIEAEQCAERIVLTFRELAGKLPLRAAFVDSLGLEARPAVHALLFALATDRAGDSSSLEHHETTAMVALLGRSFALDGTTPTAAAGVIPAMLEAFRVEGFAVPSGLDAPLGVVFIEGFVRGREERLRVDASRRALEQIVLLEVLPHIGIIVIRGEHDSEALGSHLESLAREAFARELAACVIDAQASADQADLDSPVLHFSELVASIGTHVIFVGPSSATWAEVAHTEARPTVLAAVDAALHHARLVVRDDRSFVVPFRGFFRGRTARKR